MLAVRRCAVRHRPCRSSTSTRRGSASRACRPAASWPTSSATPTRRPSGAWACSPAGPYMCAGHSNYTACMYNATHQQRACCNTMQADINNWSGTLDRRQGERRRTRRSTCSSAAATTTVGPNPMNAVQAQYTNNGVPAANLDYGAARRAPRTPSRPTSTPPATTPAAAARRPTSATAATTAPKAALTRHLRHAERAQRRARREQLHRVRPDRRSPAPTPAWQPTGWVYVPANCAGGTQPASCTSRLHGCQQSYSHDRRQVHQEHRLHALGRHQRHHRAVSADQGRQH